MTAELWQEELLRRIYGPEKAEEVKKWIQDHYKPHDPDQEARELPEL